jgi:hypothetical protein
MARSLGLRGGWRAAEYVTPTPRAAKFIFHDGEVT